MGFKTGFLGWVRERRGRVGSVRERMLAFVIVIVGSVSQSEGVSSEGKQRLGSSENEENKKQRERRQRRRRWRRENQEKNNNKNK